VPKTTKSKCRKKVPKLVDTSKTSKNQAASSTFAIDSQKDGLLVVVLPSDPLKMADDKARGVTQRQSYPLVSLTSQ
jgi:hypothetical protein